MLVRLTWDAPALCAFITAGAGHSDESRQPNSNTL